MTKALALLAFVFVLFVETHAQQTPLISNTEGRHTTSLNGPWRMIIDPYETGYYDYRYQPRSDGYFKNTKPQQPGDLVEYDFDSSPTLNVPGDWNTQDEKLLFYEGTIWYKRSFDYRKTDQKRLFVYFGAANYVADVYLNGQKLGRHEGGFTPFNFEITKVVKEKDNYLVVKVDNKRRRDAVPTLNTDWWNYGGLTRPVSLVEVPATFIRHYFLQLRKGTADEVFGWVTSTGGWCPGFNGRDPELHVRKTSD